MKINVVENSNRTVAGMLKPGVVFKACHEICGFNMSDYYLYIGDSKCFNLSKNRVTDYIPSGFDVEIVNATINIG